MLDEKGYKRSTYEEIKTAITKSVQERFGADINVSDNGVFGSIISLLSAVYSEIEQKQEDSYNSAFVSTATGISLDRLANNFGLIRKTDTYTIIDIAIVGKPNYKVAANSGFRTSDNLVYVLSEDVLLDENGKGTGLCYANEKGAKYNIPSGVQLNQVQPVSDVYAIYTSTTGTTGADLETDTQLRDRINYAAKGVNSSTYNGLVSAIKEVNGVSMVRIIENHENTVDSYGNPPYSIHIYASGGEDKSVASSIFNSLAIGINTYGSISVNVVDLANNTHEIMFDRPNNVNIFSKITIHATDSFPTDGIALVKEQVKEYINSLNMGDTVRYSYLFKYIYDNVVGVSFADITLGKDNTNLIAQDLVINPFEISVYNPDNINVVVQND